jgi:hypothetical protein
MHPRGLFVAIWLASASVMLAPLVAFADENLPAKREACQTHARQQIKAPRKGVDLYRLVIERRQVYMRDCMARAPNEEITTGSVRSSPVPLPPRRPASPRK